MVVKPADGYSSTGVQRVDRAGALSAAIESTLAASAGLSRDAHAGEGPTVVVEEYVDGPELVAECLVRAGVPKVVLLGDKGSPQGPFFEEGIYQAPSHSVTAPVLARIRHDVEHLLGGLQMEAGAAHVELRVASDGTPYIIDVGLRVGGSGVSHWITKACTGLDLFGEVIAGLAGEQDRLPQVLEPVRAAGNYIIQTGGTGVIDHISGLDDLTSSSSSSTVEVIRLMQPGDVVLPYPNFSGYPGFVLSSHPSTAELESFHALLARCVGVVFA